MTTDNRRLSDMELTNISFRKNTIQVRSNRNYNGLALTKVEANLIYNVSDSSLNLPVESPYITFSKRSLDSSSDSMIMSSLHLTDNTTPSNRKSSNTMSSLRLTRSSNNSNKNQPNKSFESEENSALIAQNQISELIETLITDDDDSEILQRSADRNPYRNVSERKKKRKAIPFEQENCVTATKRRRKLYNPDEVLIEINIDDNLEREERWRKKQPKTGTIIRDHVLNQNNNNKNHNNVEVRRSKRNSEEKLNSTKEFEYNQDIASLKDHLRQIELLKQSIQPRKNPKTSTPLSKMKKNTLLSKKKKNDSCLRRSACCQKVKDNKSKKKKKKCSPEDDAVVIQRRTSERLSASVEDNNKKNQHKAKKSPEKRKSNRRSSFYFDLVSQTSKKSNGSSKAEKLPQTIVCTKLHRSDVEFFGKAVGELGKFIVENNVSSKTTHLVAGEPKRTINMLRAMSRGCWVVSFEWVLRSLKAGKWLPEEPFEVTEFSSIVQQARLERRAFGPQFTLDVFQNCGSIYVAPETTPSRADLEELISLCKGKVVKTLRLAKIVVGKVNLVNRSFDEMPKHINETWILDSIMHNKKMPFRTRYLYVSE